MRIVILTISDRSFRGERTDSSGPVLVTAVQNLGWEVVHKVILPDERSDLERVMISWADSDEVDIILTTGGTGFSSRDITPESTLAVIDRQAPGLAEAMRSESLRITPHAMLSRAVAGIRKKAIIINLPGSPKAALENFQVIAPVLPHAVQLLHDDVSAEAGH